MLTANAHSVILCIDNMHNIPAHRIVGGGRCFKNERKRKMLTVDCSMQNGEPVETALCEVRGLSKAYKGFQLKNVEFRLEPGYIMGFVGRNGAGKSTTIKSMLRLVKPDDGEVKMFGMDYAENEEECKRRLGIVLGEFDYYADKRLKTVTGVVKRFYPEWDGAAYKRCIARFDLDESKRVKELSAGMRVKYALALALSHNARLLILDEPTSGLDPVSRDELLDLFREFVSDGTKSILFSTHITSDLDKCADYIMYIKDGSIVMSGDREEIIGGYRIVGGGKADLTPELENALIGIKETPFGFTGLISEKDLYVADGLRTAPADIESIMLYTEKYEIHQEA